MFLSPLRHSRFLPLSPWQISFSFVVVSVGLLPLSLFALLSLGWRDANVAGDLRLAFFFVWFVVCSSPVRTEPESVIGHTREETLMHLKQ